MHITMVQENTFFDIHLIPQFGIVTIHINLQVHELQNNTSKINIVEA